MTDKSSIDMNDKTSVSGASHSSVDMNDKTSVSGASHSSVDMNDKTSVSGASHSSVEEDNKRPDADADVTSTTEDSSAEQGVTAGDTAQPQANQDKTANNSSKEQKPRLPPPKAFGPAKMPSTNFREDHGKRDVVLQVDGGQLYCDKAILVMWSLYFRIKFSTKEYKGQKKCEMTLEGKSLEDVEELLHIIYPPNKRISDENVIIALELSQEFEMKEVKRRCETFLVKSKITPQLLITAQNYNLPGLKKKCIDILKTKKYSDFKNEEGFLDALNRDIHVLLLHERIKFIENKVGQSEKKHEKSKNLFREIIDCFAEIQEINSKPIKQRTLDQAIEVCDDVLDLLNEYDTSKTGTSSQSKQTKKKGSGEAGGWK